MIFFMEIREEAEAKAIRARKDARFVGVTAEGKEQWQCKEGPVKYYLLPLDKKARQAAEESSMARLRAMMGR